MDEEERHEGEGLELPDRQPEVAEVMNPWRDIFFRPRATIRWLLANETVGTAQILWLSFTAFFIVMLFLTLMFYPGNFDRQASKLQLVVFTPVIFLVSWGYFIAGSYLFYLFSRLLGGRCAVWEMQVVNAYTTVIPGVFLGLLRLGVFFFIDRKGLMTTVFNNVIFIWSAYITLGGIAAAAGISTWRALVVYLASTVIWAAVIGAAAALLPAVAGLLPGML